MNTLAIYYIYILFSVFGWFIPYFFYIINNLGYNYKQIQIYAYFLGFIWLKLKIFNLIFYILYYY